MKKRSATFRRETKETLIDISLDLDGEGRTQIETGIPFFNHMLDQLGRHGNFDLNIEAKGDLEIDAHHTVEDVGIAIGNMLQRSSRGKTWNPTFC